MDRASKVGVNLLGLTDPDYPAALKELPDPPVVLWVRGQLPVLEVVPKAIGVVGTRKCSPWALQFTRQLSRELTQADVVVVSGLARGIDTAAHQACIEAGGVTVGVLGSGVDTIYPAENKRLVPQMVLVSEHPLGTRPMSHHFPERNRIIAGLSAGSIVIEGEVDQWSHDHCPCCPGLQQNSVCGSWQGRRCAGFRSTQAPERRGRAGRKLPKTSCWKWAGRGFLV